jgi:hypothetical protein
MGRHQNRSYTHTTRYKPTIIYIGFTQQYIVIVL